MKKMIALVLGLACFGCKDKQAEVGNRIVAEELASSHAQLFEAQRKAAREENSRLAAESMLEALEVRVRDLEVEVDFYKRKRILDRKEFETAWLVRETQGADMIFPTNLSHKLLEEE